MLFNTLGFVHPHPALDPSPPIGLPHALMKRPGAADVFPDTDAGPSVDPASTAPSVQSDSELDVEIPTGAPFER